MIIRPLSRRAGDAIMWPLAIITAPVWGVLFGLLLLTVWLERVLDPPGWRRVFAWWPVECDPWPDFGFSGWVWLEMVWRNPQSPAFTKFRREPPHD